MFKGHKISLVLPCRNEEAGLRAMLVNVPDVVDEVVVVDNCSTDETASVARQHGALVADAPEPGYGNAYKSGFAAATGDIIVTMDADDTYPLHAVPELLETMFSRDLDFITVRRMHLDWERTAGLITRFIGKKALDFSCSLLLLRMIHDTQSGMWIFKKQILSSMNLDSPGMSFSEEIKMEAFVRLGRRAAELPVVYQYRPRAGSSKLNLLSDGFNNLFFIFVKRMRLLGHAGKH